jgi:hypothetical protein
MEPTTVPKKLDKELATIESEVTTYEGQANAMMIDSDESNTEATELLGMLSTKAKSIEENRKFFTAPLNEQVKAINAKFKPQTEAIDTVIRIIKKKVGQYHLAVEETKAKEQKRLDDIRARADAKRKTEGKETIAVPVRQVEQHVQTTKTATSSTTVKKVWKFEITDVKKLPDHVKIAIFQEALKKDLHNMVVRKFVGAGMHEIEGVRIYQDTEVSVK